MNSTGNPNDRLRQLLITARDYPPRTVARQNALEEFFSVLFNCGRLYRPHRQRLPASFAGSYPDVYRDARQNLMLYICEHLDKYEPERGEVLTWVNLLLQKRFIPELIKTMSSIEQQSITFKDIDLDALKEQEIQQYLAAQEPSFADSILAKLQSREGERFAEIHVTGYPQANLKALIIKRLANQPWKEISAEMGIGISTLSSFYRRQVLNCKDKLGDLIA
ncbi:hypothetical protein [Roseofilum casamattae]|uniref:Sigma-70 family RNA polymerase sigma factor n=1 Tax=Roseofilum casamattae BLCC-M143 TaxID=3022442 RepID=A0ABT7BXA1_9CYAN|nr:hypothetical protein [Roseofilum casamattae]MDJ1183096.1 hypothetical protein [Roseofilum casamattae BLCC-M143]